MTEWYENRIERMRRFHIQENDKTRENLVLLIYIFAFEIKMFDSILVSRDSCFKE